MRKGKFKKLYLLLLIILLIPIKTKAVTFQVTKTADNLKPGGVTTVIVNGDAGSDKLASYNLTISYDSNKLEFAGGNGVQAKGNTVIITKNAAQTGRFEAGRFNLRARNIARKDSTTLDLKSTCTYDQTEENKNCSATNNSTSIVLYPFGTSSLLSSLKIPNTTLKPAFDKNITSYTATIQDIKELTVNAVPEDNNAKIDISSNAKNLQKGENKVDIVVTSEDGQNKTIYSVNITLNLTPTDEELLKANAKLKDLKVRNYKIDFEEDEKKYYLTIPYKITKLNIDAEAVNPKAKVEIDGNKKLLVRKNTIKIMVTSEDKSKSEIYQIVVTREEQKKKIVQTCPDVTSKREWIIFTISMILIFSLGLVLGYLVSKFQILQKLFHKKEKEKPELVDSLSDTIDLSKTVKKVKKKTTKKTKK